MSTQQLIENVENEAAPQTAAAPKTPAAPPSAPQPPAQPLPPVNVIGNVWHVKGRAAPRWIAFLALFVRLIWPLAILGSGVALFVVIGASGWLWLAILLILVCALAARPTLPPSLS